MASAWADTLPRVTVPLGNTPKRVTLIYPYYENPMFLERQMIHWLAMGTSSLQPHFEIVIVDDGSVLAPASQVVLGSAFNVPVRLFQIEVDRPWNWLAARNIGAHHAEDGWLLMTDMDHLVPFETLTACVYGQHDPAVVYAFSREEHTGESVTPHSASFLLTKRLFWQIGGYDEALSGRYGTDGDYRRRLQQYAPIHVLTDYLVRYEYVADSSTAKYRRKLPEDAVAVKRLIAARPKNWTPKTLSFPYHEVVVTEAVCS